MSKYIDADAVLNNLPNDLPYKASVKRVLIQAPSADVVEVRHGEWEYRQLDEYKYYEVTCSCCGAKYWGNYDAYNEPDEFYYCPNCGAKMDGESEDTE